MLAHRSAARPKDKPLRTITHDSLSPLCADERLQSQERQSSLPWPTATPHNCMSDITYPSADVQMSVFDDIITHPIICHERSQKATKWRKWYGIPHRCTSRYVIHGQGHPPQCCTYRSMMESELSTVLNMLSKCSNTSHLIRYRRII